MTPTPIRVSATLRGQLGHPDDGVALDALLMWARSRELGLPPVVAGEPRDTLEIPIVLAPGGRFHLCSHSLLAVERHATAWTRRRFPVREAQLFGAASVRRIGLAVGPTKSYNLPLEVGHLGGDRLEWYAVGDAAEVRRLLALVVALGKKRGHGFGAVERWEVEPAEPWGDGFPVVRDGRALRPLPSDWPGLVEPELAVRTLSPPYWDRTRREVVAVPHRG